MTTLSLFMRCDGLLEAGDDETMTYLNRVMPAQEIKVRANTQNTGTVNMLRTWRMWMRETADWMAWQGATMPLCFDKQGKPHGKRAFNEHDAHELFTAKWMGVDEQGNRYSWRLRGELEEGTTSAPKSKRLFAMELHENWCIERGIKITIPENSEYRKLKLEQIR